MIIFKELFVFVKTRFDCVINIILLQPLKATLDSCYVNVHACYITFLTGNDLICLDPHVTQPTVNLSDDTFDDSSYHIPYGGSKRMPIKDIDPSISLVCV